MWPSAQQMCNATPRSGNGLSLRSIIRGLISTGEGEGLDSIGVGEGLDTAGEGEGVDTEGGSPFESACAPAPAPECPAICGGGASSAGIEGTMSGGETDTTDASTEPTCNPHEPSIAVRSTE